MPFSFELNSIRAMLLTDACAKLDTKIAAVRSELVAYLMKRIDAELSERASTAAFAVNSTKDSAPEVPPTEPVTATEPTAERGELDLLREDIATLRTTLRNIAAAMSSNSGFNFNPNVTAKVYPHLHPFLSLLGSEKVVPGQYAAAYRAAIVHEDALKAELIRELATPQLKGGPGFTPFVTLPRGFNADVPPSWMSPNGRAPQWARQPNDAVAKEVMPTPGLNDRKEIIAGLVASALKNNPGIANSNALLEAVLKINPFLGIMREDVELALGDLALEAQPVQPK